MYNDQAIEAELLAMSRISSEGFIVFSPHTHVTHADFIVYDKKTSKSYTVQVKSTSGLGSRHKNSYIFDVRPNNAKRKYDDVAFDIYAFVVIDKREVRFEWRENLPAKTQINFHISDKGKYPWFPNKISSIIHAAQ